MTAGFRMEMASVPGEAAQVLEAFAAFVESRHVPTEARRQLMVVLDEILANFASHALADHADGRATVEAVVLPGALEVTLTDNGSPFDPLAHATPDTALSVEKRPIGGLGIHLMHALVDEARYARIGNTNVLVLTKRFPSGSSPALEGGT